MSINIELETLMWQTGYLTIDKAYETYRGIKYKLTIPNKEVKLYIMSTIAHFMTKIHNPIIIEDTIYEALINCDFSSLEKSLRSLYASIPYNLSSTKLSVVTL